MDQTKPALVTVFQMTTPSCPCCHSTHIETLGHGRRIGGTIGVVAGAVSGAAGASGGAEIGAAAVRLAYPVSAILDGIVGAIMSGIAGATAGGLAGSQLGRIVDENILDNYRCYSCNHTFCEPALQARLIDLN